MGDASEEKKRPRSDSVDDSAESDLTTSDSPESKRPRVNSDLDSPDVKRIQDDLFDILDVSDGPADRDPVIQGLDSVIRSFEEEILVPAEPPPAVSDVASELTDAQTELGYLLEASDDELGLPPSFGGSEDERKSESAEPPVTSACEFMVNDSIAYEDEMPNYDSFEFGMCGELPEVGCQSSENDGQYVTLGGLFDYTDDGIDAPELLWRPESLPAI